VSSTFAVDSPASAEVDPIEPGLAQEETPVLHQDSTAAEIDLQPATPQASALEETLASSADEEVPATSAEAEVQPEIPGEFDIAALAAGDSTDNHDPETTFEASHPILPGESGEGEDWTPAFEPTTPTALATDAVESSTPAPPSWAPQTLASLPVEASTPTLAPAPPKAVAAPPVFEPVAARSLPRKPKVLVVDDSPTVCKLVTITLSNRGYHVMSSPDGAEAISELAQSKPDLILMDITMPKLDGYKLCKLVTSHPSTKHIPVVMLSGKDGFFDKTRGKFAGCVDYITKPFDPENLLRVVNEYLPQPESARGASAAGPMRIRAGGG
jgi:twitching motility two-component system response regulator PilG